MNNKNFGFCENKDISHKIHNLITDNLLGKEQLSKIERRYDDMRNNFFSYPKEFVTEDKREWKFSDDLKPFAPKGRGCYSDTTAVPIPITHPDFIDLTTRTEEQGRGAIGLDLPTWFYQSSEAPFIMIVTQDPLRSAKWYGDEVDEKYICNDAVVSSPFGLQDAHHRERGTGGKRMWLLVRSLLERGYNVYLTDCRKFFVYNHTQSDKYTTAEKMDIYRNILKKEIEIINPKLIVTLGHSAHKSCQELLGDNKRLSDYIPHFSGTAGHKIKEFFELDSKTNINELANLYADYIGQLVEKSKQG
ncbi:MAG: hypothetical protein K2K27_03850 [Muribaculaceae bacterium]|nr:hypothetical protein [Muribaculaceae bacterium]